MTAITDVPGLRVGHAGRTGGGWLSGVTVVLPPAGTVGSVDVRGGGPGTHETDALDPTTLTRTVDAVVLTGGSAFGLAAAHGAQRWCEENGRGFAVTGGVVPIVPAAAIFDLGRGGDFAARPDAAMGYAATADAAARRIEHDVERGNVGAGTGALIGRGQYKGGVGTASITLDNGVVVGALAVVNALGLPFGTSPARGEPGSMRLSDEGASTPRVATARAQHHPRRRRHERDPGQGRVQAHGVGRARRAGPGAEPQPHPRGRGHRLLPRHRRARTGPQQRGRPAGEPHHPAERGSRRRAPGHPGRDQLCGGREHAGGRIWCIRTLSALRLLDLTFGP